MNRPLIVVVMGYAVGLLLGQLFQPPLTVLLVISFSVLVPSIAIKKLRPFFSLAGARAGRVDKSGCSHGHHFAERFAFADRE